MKSTNPIFNERNFQEAKGREYTDAFTNPMTVSGTVNKSFALIFICMIGAMFSWTRVEMFSTLMWPILLVDFVLAFIIIFKKHTAPVLAPIYALGQGMVLGAISSLFEAQFAHIVAQAVGITIATFLVMFMLYKTRIIKVTQTFRAVIIGATAGIAVFYIVMLIASFFGAGAWMHGTSKLSIGISVFVCAIAALNLTLDFDFIERAAASNFMPKHMEWYGAFGILITLIWLYIEVLNLLSKLNRR